MLRLSLNIILYPVLIRYLIHSIRVITLESKIYSQVTTKFVCRKATSIRQLSFHGGDSMSILSTHQG